MTYWQAGWTVVTVALFLVGAFQDRYVGGPMNWGWLGGAVFVAAMSTEQLHLYGWIGLSINWIALLNGCLFGALITIIWVLCRLVIRRRKA